MNQALPNANLGMIFPMYASQFALHPREGGAYTQLAPILEGLDRVDFHFQVVDPAINQGQMASDFDAVLESRLVHLGATHLDFELPHEIPQELDFAFNYKGHKVAVEIEKANREKILRDLLKCHMYFHAGADFALVVLPRNYAHKMGSWDLFDFGIRRFEECRKYGFGTSDKLSRILLLGYTQFEAATDRPLTKKIRNAMRVSAAIPK